MSALVRTYRDGEQSIECVLGYDVQSEGMLLETTYIWIQKHWPLLTSSEVCNASLCLHSCEPGQYVGIGACADGTLAVGPRRGGRGKSRADFKGEPISCFHGCPVVRFHEILECGLRNCYPGHDKKWMPGWGRKRPVVYASEYCEVSICYPYHVAIRHDFVGEHIARDTYDGRQQSPLRIVLELMVDPHDKPKCSFCYKGKRPKTGGYPRGQQLIVDESDCCTTRVRLYPFARALININELGGPTDDFQQHPFFKDPKKLKQRLNHQSAKWQLVESEFALDSIIKPKAVPRRPKRSSGSNSKPFGSGEGTRAKRRIRRTKAGYRFENNKWVRSFAAGRPLPPGRVVRHPRPEAAGEEQPGKVRVRGRRGRPLIPPTQSSSSSTAPPSVTPRATWSLAKECSID